jgi:hypothetical protein
MLEEYSRVTTSLGIVDAYAPDFDLLSDMMHWYAQVEHDGKERQVSNLGASHLLGLSQRGINNNPNEVSPEDRILAMELALLSFLIPKLQKAILASVLNRITRQYERENQGLDPDSEYIPIMIPTSVNELRC